MKLIHGCSLEFLLTAESASVDAIVTDPPYGLKFMGKKWDYDVPSVEVWKECLRVLKPGGHALIACGTRTQHRMAVNIEDAGFEIRDVVTWLYGSGFPKSLDVSKALDKAAGAERIRTGEKKDPRYNSPATESSGACMGNISPRKNAPKTYENAGWVTLPATEAAKRWQGWGTALKPACEFWTLARKPLDGTVAANVLKHGVGGINVDGCRIESPDANLAAKEKNFDGMGYGGNSDTSEVPTYNPIGRFPANLILDEEAAAMLDEQTGNLPSGGQAPNTGKNKNNGQVNFGGNFIRPETSYAGEIGGASRYFYCAKASKSERQGSTHPTMKPIKLMRYLCRLITPPGGLVLDPFMGSGSTGVAALIEGFDFIGIEREEDFFCISQKRISGVSK